MRARCVCRGGDCKCKIAAGVGVQVKGVGSEDQQFVITAAPECYSVVLTAAAPELAVNAPLGAVVGSRAAFAVEVEPGVTGVVRLPDGSSTYPIPVAGAELDFMIVGTAGSSEVAWSGGGVTWMGAPPTATELGWYHFTFAGNRFLGEYLGASHP